MKKNATHPLLILVLSIILFFYPFFLQGKLPIPSDTILSLYHPFIDYSIKHFPNGVPVKNLLITDPVRQQYPWRWLAISLEKEIQFPLWNPYSFSGTPLLANFQTAAFYPLNIFLFIFPFWLGWSLIIFLQPVLAGIFLYCYLRRMNISQPASFLGGFVFAFCGYTTAWLEWNVLVQVALWLPLILLASEYLLQKFSYRWLAVFIFAQCAAFFAGFLQAFFYMFILFATYVIARIIQIIKSENKKNHYWKTAWKKLLPFVVSTLIIVIITAIQWLPSVELIFLSNRNADLVNAWRLPGWFIPWQNLAQFVAPDFFGNPATLNYWGVWNYGEFIGYVGILPLIMILFAIFFRRDKKTLFFGVFFILSLIFSLPTIFAKIPYLLNIPFFSTSQPTRLLFITDFSMSILAALGFDYFLKNKMQKKIVYPFLLLLLAFTALWIFVLFGFTYLLVSQENATIAKHNLYFPTILFIVSGFLLIILIYLQGKYKYIRQVLIIILIGITCIDLFRFSSKFNPFTQRSYLFPQTQTLEFLQRQHGQFRIMATSSEILPPNFSLMYHLQSLDGYDPLYLLRYGEFIAALTQNKPAIPSSLTFHRIITPQNTQSRLIDLLGVKYVLSLTDLHNPKFKKVFSEGKTNIYENTKAFPRVFFVRTIKQVHRKNEAIKSLLDTQIDLHQTAIVENLDSSTKSFGNGRASIIKYQANTIQIKTQSKDETFLVLTDSFYPIWHVTVDGNEEKIYRTDYNFRGIILPQGNHNVVFYDSLL